MQFKGTGVALVTPFKKDKTVDFEALTRLTQHIINNRVDYLVALGTTSEAPVLTKDEKKAVVDTILTANNRRIPVVLGIGGNNTQEILEQLGETSFDGIDAILSVAPYYNKPGQRGLFAHFDAIAQLSPVPVILYNVPGRTSSNLTALTTLELANKHQNIVAIKEASGNFDQIMEIIAKKPENFHVISGDDALTFPMIALGASGVISVAANAFPLEFSTMVRDAMDNNIIKARELHYRLLHLVNLLFVEGNPAGVKALLQEQGHCENVLRLPLVEVSKHTYQQLQVAWHEFNNL